MATHSSIFAWEIPWIEEPGGLQSTGSQRVGYDLATKHQHLENTGSHIYYETTTAHQYALACSRSSLCEHLCFTYISVQSINTKKVCFQGLKF